MTLTGVSGTGKTRLVLQVGAQELERHSDGVSFVDLAPLADPDLVAGAVADAAVSSSVGHQDRPADRRLGPAPLLAAAPLDNCEHPDFIDAVDEGLACWTVGPESRPVLIAAGQSVTFSSRTSGRE